MRYFCGGELHLVTDRGRRPDRDQISHDLRTTVLGRPDERRPAAVILRASERRAESRCKQQEYGGTNQFVDVDHSVGHDVLDRLQVSALRTAMQRRHAVHILQHTQAG